MGWKGADLDRDAESAGVLGFFCSIYAVNSRAECRAYLGYCHWLSPEAGHTT